MCQFSPVAQRQSSKNDVEKSLKFTWTLSSLAKGSPIFAKPKRKRPIIANMKNRMISRRPSEPRDVAESNKVAKIILSCTAYLISLRILPILKARRIVGPLSNSTGIEDILRMSMIKVKVTITKSKMFQESLKYARFSAIIFITASRVKIVKKM